MAIFNFLPNNIDESEFTLIDVPSPATYNGTFLDSHFFTVIDDMPVKFPAPNLGIGQGRCKVNPDGLIQRVHILRDVDGNLAERIFC